MSILQRILDSRDLGNDGSPVAEQDEVILAWVTGKIRMSEAAKALGMRNQGIYVRATTRIKAMVASGAIRIVERDHDAK
jgi:hypothetical protein